MRQKQTLIVEGCEMDKSFDNCPMDVNIKPTRVGRTAYKIGGDVSYKKDLPENMIIDFVIQKQSSPGNWVDTVLKYKKSICEFASTEKDYWPKVVATGNLPQFCPMKKGDYTFKDAEMKFETIPPTLTPGCYKNILRYRDGNSMEEICRLISRFTVSNKDGSSPGKCSK